MRPTNGPTLLTRLANRLTEMDGKQETVKDLAKTFNCPYTSLYIPIRVLEDVGFLKLIKGKGVIQYGQQTTQADCQGMEITHRVQIPAPTETEGAIVIFSLGGEISMQARNLSKVDVAAILVKLIKELR